MRYFIHLSVSKFDLKSLIKDTKKANRKYTGTSYIRLYKYTVKKYKKQLYISILIDIHSEWKTSTFALHIYTSLKTLPYTTHSVLYCQSYCTPNNAHQNKGTVPFHDSHDDRERVLGCCHDRIHSTVRFLKTSKAF